MLGALTCAARWSSCENRPITEHHDHDETRTVFRELLDLLSDRDEQLRYEAEVPIANVPAELVCMWFDDHYHPTTAWFAEAFSPAERARLAQFDSVLATVADSLPTDAGVEGLHAAPAWQTVCAKAAETLAALDWAGPHAPE